MDRDTERAIAALVAAHAPAKSKSNGVGKRKKGVLDRGQTRNQKRSYDKAVQMADLRAQGMDWNQIAQAMGYATAAGARDIYRKVLERGVLNEDANELRVQQQKRMEQIWQGLFPKILTGRERAAEVGIKLLERQARLHGLDAVDAEKNKQSSQPINIIITADPRDSDAVKLVNPNSEALDGGGDTRALLSPPIEGVSQSEESDSSGGRNGER